MLPKFIVKGDSSANKAYSSSIIIDNLNKGAKEAGLFDENGAVVVYSTTANDYGIKCDAILCVYETFFPSIVLQNASNRPLIGCSLDNLFFTRPYPEQLTAYCQLGVDCNVFKPIPDLRPKDKIRFLAMSESNARSGLDCVIEAFGRVFTGRTDVELYIKDRGATERFKQYIRNRADFWKVSIIHDTENTENSQSVTNLYNTAHYMVFCSRSTTWGMPHTESMACGVPIISTAYSGPREFLSDNFNGFLIKHNLIKIEDNQLEYLARNGFRNHMFHPSTHHISPIWGEPVLEDLVEVLSKAYKISKTSYWHIMSDWARQTALNFTWERAACTLSLALKKVLK
jgi:glycosyltransferase involved in cell wall biosynthesis